jgi:hypothetical protein
MRREMRGAQITDDERINVLLARASGAGERERAGGEMGDCRRQARQDVR